MNEFFANYLGANVVCAIIFGIFLGHDLLGMDRQEKQIKFDHALIAFILYFLSDSVWAGVASGVFPQTRVSVVLTHFSNYILMAMVTYMWLRYVMAVEQTPHRNRKINKFAVLFPFLVSTAAMILMYIFAPQTLINDDLEVLTAFNVFLIVVPCINIAAVIIYSVGKAKSEGNPVERKRHLYIGLFPLILVFGGLLQVIWLPHTPIFCLCGAILMIMIYIQSMETQISIDPLTKLNNRSQVMRYVTQSSNLFIEGKKTFVVMMDINDFKAINDTYGHAEGDSALTVIAESIKDAIGGQSIPAFIARYGGDEFVLIIYTDGDGDVEPLIEYIRGRIDESCRKEEKPYTLSVSAGYDELSRDQDTFAKCLQRADAKLYIDKEKTKHKDKTAVGE